MVEKKREVIMKEKPVEIHPNPKKAKEMDEELLKAFNAQKEFAKILARPEITKEMNEELLKAFKAQMRSTINLVSIVAEGGVY